MDTECMEGAYKGFPFKIYFDEGAPWDIVDPRCRIDEVVIMCYGRDGHVNYGQKQEELCEGALHTLVSERMGLIIKNRRKETGERTKLSDDEYADMEEEISDDLSAALRAKSMKDIKNILDQAEVPYLARDLRGGSQSEFCETLYFFEDGRKFSKQDKKEYEMEMADITCWVWGSCYTAEVAGESCSGFVAEDYPDINDNSPISDFIKEVIDRLLSKKKANYTVTADYAIAEENDYGEYSIKFDKEKKLKIHVDSEEIAKKITGIFKGNALSVNNTKSRQN